MAISEKAKAQVYLDGKQAEAALDGLKTKAKELRKAMNEARKAGNFEEYHKLEKEVKQLDSAKRSLTQATFDYQKVLRNINGASYNDLNKALRTTQSQMRRMKATDAGFAEKQKEVQTLRTRIRQLNGDLKAQPTMWERAREGFKNYSTYVMAGVTAISGAYAVLRKVSEAAIQREENKDAVAALTGLSPEAMAELEGMAVKSATTLTEGNVRLKKSTDDILNAYGIVGSKRAELLKDADALHNVTQDAMILAEAGKRPLEEAANTHTTIMNQFQATVADSRRIINIIAAGNQAGAANIEYLGEAMEKTGTSANMMGISIEETAGVIEAMAPFYSRAEMMGNSFDKVLLKLKATNIGYKDGVFNLNDAIDELAKRYAKGETAAKIFGVEHSKMGELLVQNKSEILRYTEAVTGTNKAIEQAAINTDNSTAKLAQAKNRIREYTIELGTKLSPAMVSVTEGTASFIKMLTGAVGFVIDNKMAISQLVITLGAYTAAVKMNLMWNQKNLTLHRAKILVLGFFSRSYGKLTGAVKAQTTAQKANNMALKANVYAAIAAAVVFLIQKLIQYNKEAIKVDKTHKNYISTLVEEKGKANDLFETYKKLNPESEEAKRIKDKLVQLYPDLMSKYVTEKGFIEDIAKAQKDVNDEILRTVALRSKEGEIEELAEKTYNRQQVIYGRILNRAGTPERKGALSSMLGEWNAEMNAENGSSPEEFANKVANFLDIEIKTDEYGFTKTGRAAKEKTTYDILLEDIVKLKNLNKDFEAAKDDVNAFYSFLKNVVVAPVGGKGGGEEPKGADAPIPTLNEQIETARANVKKLKQELADLQSGKTPSTDYATAIADKKKALSTAESTLGVLTGVDTSGTKTTTKDDTLDQQYQSKINAQKQRYADELDEEKAHKLKLLDIELWYLREKEKQTTGLEQLTLQGQILDKEQEISKLTQDKTEDDSAELLRKYESIEQAKTRITKQWADERKKLEEAGGDASNFAVLDDKYKKQLEDLTKQTKAVTNDIAKLFANMSGKSANELSSLADEAERILDYLTAGEYTDGAFGISEEDYNRIANSPEELEKVADQVQNLRYWATMANSAFGQMVEGIEKLSEGNVADGLTILEQGFGKVLNAANMLTDSLEVLANATGSNFLSSVSQGISDVAEVASGAMNGAMTGLAQLSLSQTHFPSQRRAGRLFGWRL
ncbi:MAG: phage tail tape measure protein [Bacteroidales bacterium]